MPAVATIASAGGIDIWPSQPRAERAVQRTGWLVPFTLL